MVKAGGISPDLDEISPDFDLGKLLTPRRKKGARAEVSSDLTASDRSPSYSLNVSSYSDTSEMSVVVEKKPRSPTSTKSGGKPRRAKKRSQLPSSSGSDGGNIKSEPRTVHKNYTSPSEIAKIFRKLLTTDTLCKLSALQSGTPSDVKEIIPEASVAQICRMCDL